MRLFLLAVLLMSGWGMAQSSEPTLADLSKQARERKAKIQKPARLITNADLKNFQNAPVSISKAPEQPQATDQTKTDAQTPETPEEAAYAKLLAEWKPRFQAAVMDQKNAVNKGLVLQLRLNNMTNSYNSQTDEGARARFGMEVDQTTKNIETNKEEIAAAEKAIEDLKLEARAAGVEESDIAAMVGDLAKTSTISELAPEEPEENKPNPPEENTPNP